MKPQQLVFATALVAVFWCSAANAQEWTRFRGPNGTGISAARGLPVEWTEQDYLWKTALPGDGGGHSSPVIWGNKIFLTSCLDHATDPSIPRMVLCLDAETGQILWLKRFESRRHTRHPFNSFASATPAVDAERVYAVWSTPDEYTIVALDHDGNQVWYRDLGPFVSQHSCGTSPIVFEDMVVLSNDQDKDSQDAPDVHGTSSVIALDARTGKTRWQVPRRSGVVAYSTPCLYQAGGETPQLIFNSDANGITSIDPYTGAVNWELVDVFDKRSCSSPVLAAGLIFGTCGSGGGGNYLVAARAATLGSDASVAYKITRAAPYVPTPLAKGNRIFLWGDNGVVSCLEASSGETIWSKRVGEADFFGSPVWAEGRIYCISSEGEVFVISDADEFQLLGRNPLGELCRSTPAIANNTLYLRTYSHLIAIRGKLAN